MRPKIDLFILIVVCLVFLNSLLWIFSIPFNGAPDEYDHYRLAAFIADHGRIPVLGRDQDFYFSSIVTHFPATQELITYHEQNAHVFKNTFLYELKPVYMMWPCGPYILSGLAMKLGNFFPGVPLFYFGRFFSALCAVLIVFLVYDMSRKLRPEDRLFQKLTALVVGFLPQFTFLSAYINPDIVTVLVATLIIRSWFYALDTGWSPHSAILLGIALGAGILSKISGYSVIAATVFFLAIALPAQKRMRFCAYLFGACLGVSLWFFVRNAVLYGDLLGYTTYTQHLKEFLAQAPRFIVQHDMFSFLNQAGYRWSFSYLAYFCYSSFWGVFGWMTVSLPKAFYVLGGAVLLLAASGLARVFLQRKNIFPPKIFFSFLAVFVLQIISIVLYVMMIKYQPQGRYLYPAICPIAALISSGILALAGNLVRRELLFFAGASFIITMNIFSFLYCGALQYFLPFA